MNDDDIDAEDMAKDILDIVSELPHQRRSLHEAIYIACCEWRRPHIAVDVTDRVFRALAQQDGVEYERPPRVVKADEIRKEHEAARAAKDFAKADALRQEMHDIGGRL